MLWLSPHESPYRHPPRAKIHQAKLRAQALVKSSRTLLNEGWRWLYPFLMRGPYYFFHSIFLLLPKSVFRKQWPAFHHTDRLYHGLRDITFQITLSLEPYLYIFQDPLYATAYIHSLKVAFVATLMTLLLGYPMAYGISRAKGKMQWILLVMVTLPFWTSFLIWVYAWIGILAGGLS